MPEPQRAIRFVRCIDAQHRRQAACVGLGAGGVLDRGGGGFTAHAVAYRTGGVAIVLERARHFLTPASPPTLLALITSTTVDGAGCTPEAVVDVAREVPNAAATSALIAAGSTMLTS